MVIYRLQVSSQVVIFIFGGSAINPIVNMNISGKPLQNELLNRLRNMALQDVPFAQVAITVDVIPFSENSQKYAKNGIIKRTVKSLLIWWLNFPTKKRGGYVRIATIVFIELYPKLIDTVVLVVLDWSYIRTGQTLWKFFILRLPKNGIQIRMGISQQKR